MLLGSLDVRLGYPESSPHMLKLVPTKPEGEPPTQGSDFHIHLLGRCEPLIYRPGEKDGLNIIDLHAQSGDSTLRPERP